MNQDESNRIYGLNIPFEPRKEVSKQSRFLGLFLAVVAVAVICLTCAAIAKGLA